MTDPEEPSKADQVQGSEISGADGATPVPEPVTRSGFAAVIGAPNAGKSTLVNRLVGEKVSIVTHKVQTTRFQVRGVMLRGAAQVVLVDTPGVFAPRHRLDRAMVQAAWSGAADADAILHLVDAHAEYVMSQNDASKSARAAARRGVEDAARVVDGLKASGRRALLALNKIDALPRDALLEQVARFSAHGVYDEVFLIAALNGDGVEAVAEVLARAMPEGPWLYPADQVGDLPLRLLAAEITREKVFLRLHEELPYRSTVETDAWDERKDGSVRIDQTLFVERESQRAIALGKGGATIKAIGQGSREELERLLDRRVHLFLHVKVREGWMDDRARFSAFGLDFDA